VTVKHNPGVG